MIGGDKYDYENNEEEEMKIINLTTEEVQEYFSQQKVSSFDFVEGKTQFNG